MASNPMQRKARNSFLAGIALTTLILGSLIAFLLFQQYQSNKKQEAIEKSKVQVYVLSQDVKAGTKIGDVLSRVVEVDSQLAPETAITALNYGTSITENTVFKIDLKLGTVLTQEMLVESEDVAEADTREQEYNMIILPTYLQADDYIDIRLKMPSGEDYIVVSKKKVLDTDETTIWMNLSEAEILTLGNAIVEAYIIPGSELYATTYIEPGIQEKAFVTYIPNASVSVLIENDPNVIQEAKDELRIRYNMVELWKDRTDVINPHVNAVGEEQQGKVSAGVSSSTESRKQSRTEYLQELESAATTTTVQ